MKNGKEDEKWRTGRRDKINESESITELEWGKKKDKDDHDVENEDEKKEADR